MRIKKYSIPFVIFALITAVFFYKSILHGYVPFPGDLLISEYNPWKFYSFLGYAPGSYPNKAQYFDVIRQIFPWKTFSISMMKNGQFPFWNPYNFSGTPLFANFQSSVLYPLNIFYFFLPQDLAWSILVYLQPVLAGYFTFIYCRNIGISKIGSYFSGITFAFSSFMTVWLEYNTIGHVIAWLPLTLFSIESLLQKRKIAGILVFLFSLTAALVAGHPQVFIYIVLYTICYVVYRIFSIPNNHKKREQIIVFSWLFFLVICLGAIKILPGTELILLSARSVHSYSDFVNKILIQPSEIIMFLIPDFFGNPVTRTFWLNDTYIGDLSGIGLIPLLFIFLTIPKWREVYTKFYLWSAMIIFLLITTNPLTKVLYSFNIPVLSSSAPTLAVFLFCFSLSILSGIGIDILLKEKYVLWRFLYMLLPLISVLLLLLLCILFEPKLGFLQGKNHAVIALHSVLYEGIIIFFAILFLSIPLFKNKLLFLMVVCLLGVHVIDDFHAFDKFNPFIPKEFVYPKTPVLSFLKKTQGVDRMIGFGFSRIEPNIETQSGIFSPEGYDPLYSKRYGEFIQSSKNGHIITKFTDQTRSDANIEPASGDNFYTNSFRQKIINIVGVKYILDRFENNSTEKTFPPSIFKNIYANNGWRIYQNMAAVPRVFMTNDYKVFHTNSEFEKYFFNKTFASNKTLLLEKNIPVKLDATLSNIKLEQYLPNTVKLQTKANGNGLLFLSDSYYPGWKAFIDGHETAIYRADYTFRSIIIPEGRHEVTFTFDSASFKIGSIISIISVLSVIVWMFFLYLHDVVI